MSRGEKVHDIGSNEYKIRRRNDQEAHTTSIVKTEHRELYKGRWYGYTLKTSKGVAFNFSSRSS